MTQENLFDAPAVEVPFYQSVLKSALQKRIRRGETDAALRIAKSMIEKDAHDFARRIMVVVPEESWVHPLLMNMPNIISKLQRKGVKPSDMDISTMLTLVRDASEAKTRDFYLKNPDDRPFEPAQLEYLNDRQRGLVNAIMYRATIGGMKPDIAMFNSLANIWTQRFSNQTFKWEQFGEIFPMEQPMVEWADIEYATAEDIPYYAVDFHCFPPIAKLLLRRQKKTGEPIDNPIADYIADNFEGMVVSLRGTDTRDMEIVKKTMWLFEVSKNTKPNHWFETPRVVDWFTDANFQEPLQFKPQLEELNSIMSKQWQGVADWYVKSQAKGV